MSNDLAGSERSVSPGFDPPPQGDGLPSGSLREAWADQLRDIEQAKSWDTLSGAFQYSAGWLAALVQANVIDWPTNEALRAERNTLHNAANARLAGGGQ